MINILIIDDDNDRIRKIAAAVKGDSINVEHVMTKNEALCKLEENEYDLVIIDIMLPENIDSVNPQPTAGIDIIKDIEETIYYCTITKAMKEGAENHEPEVMYYGGYRKEHPSWREKDMRDWSDDRRYYDSKGSQHTSSNSSGHTNGEAGNSNSYYTEREYPHAFEDEREGKSYRSRRMYMESKESK